MEEKIKSVIQERPIIIPRILFKDYKKLNILEEELILLIYLIDMGDKIIYNPDIFVKELGFDKFKAMEIISNLVEKNIISLVVEKNRSGKTEEYIDVSLLYNKLYNDIFDVEDDDEEDITNIFSRFENEFGRPISPMEYEIIKGWINDRFSEELITEALKEAVYNNVNNLRYIDKILYNWKKKGYKNREDIVKDKARVNKKKEVTVGVFDYNWLDDE